MKDLAIKTDIHTDYILDIKYRIIKHIKNKHGRYIATFLAIPIDDKKVGVAWSKCHRLDLEKNTTDRISSKKKGLQIAINRIINGTKVPVPTTLKDQMTNFLNNITKYYQDKEVIIPVGMDGCKEEFGLPDNIVVSTKAESTATATLEKAA